MNKTAEEFWKTVKEYPPFVYTFQRRYLDLGIILKYAGDINSILDLGCGEGQILLMLRELTNIKKYYGYDLSQTFIDNLISRWGNWPGLKVSTTNFSTFFNEFPKTDVCICMGVMPYIFDDAVLNSMLINIKSKLLIVRVPCIFEQNRLEIDKFSDDFNGRYAAVYRTIPEYISILSDGFIINSIDRCYPDEIESKYDSKQFFFVCKRR